MFSSKRIWLPALLFLISKKVDAVPAPAEYRNKPAVPGGEFEHTWVAGPQTRGTLELLFSCVITLVLCVWTTVHVNIEPENSNWIWERARKIWWACVTLVIPEGALVIAMNERTTADLLCKEVNRIIEKHKNQLPGVEEWEIALGYYAVMGGFVVPEKVYDTVLKEIPPAERGTIKRLTLTPHGLLSLITAKEVLDKSNANTLTKAIVVWQALWMIVQVIGRTASHFPVTLLELHTVLHTFCAVAMYITWWHKPVDIQTPSTVPFVVDGDEKEKLTTSHNDRDMVFSLIKGTDLPDPTSALEPPRPLKTSDTENPEPSAEVLNIKPTTETTPHIRLQFGIITLVGLIYGSVHLAAWNNRFPTPTEQLLWKISAAITAATWGTFYVSLYAYNILGWPERKTRRLEGFRGAILRYGFAVAIIPVALVRIYLLTESFASIRKVPLGSYEIPKWSNAWPHAG
ncbi:uncharacterized protein K441DRAFT_551251 [Cenococcum geophilum 1.58]|uniref:uncharacterized protein n=1 Tax=Cenococcum geophilum 1.58 TaxID=794803 RepID=UPI00358F1C55|nr:hypothetical protein K441DRAFT_551251 [Cenococcum geophilum 1.58]